MALLPLVEVPRQGVEIFLTGRSASHPLNFPFSHNCLAASRCSSLEARSVVKGATKDERSNLDETNFTLLSNSHPDAVGDSVCAG
jgi:hypothetical protein